MDEYPILMQYEIDNDTGLFSISVNVECEENGATKQERWLYVIKKLREAADILEVTWK